MKDKIQLTIIVMVFIASIIVMLFIASSIILYYKHTHIHTLMTTCSTCSWMKVKSFTVWCYSLCSCLCAVGVHLHTERDREREGRKTEERFA